MKKWTGRKILYLAGWTIDPINPPHARCVVIAAPHTSNWDFPMMLLSTNAFGLEIKWMAKDSIFPGPISYFLRKFGGIPIVRNKSNNSVNQMIELFGKKNNVSDSG